MTKILINSSASTEASRHFFIKEKFFSFEELLGIRQRPWIEAFSGGQFAVFRLTPEKYHYNHLPVSGKVIDYYTIDGDYHSCNPTAVAATATPYSKNRRVVTIIETDVPGGTGIGLTAGDTKKIIYASNIGNNRVVAIQAITAVLYTIVGLAAALLFLEGHQTAALLLSFSVTQLWRFLSEFLRADFRGGGRISAYQIMALVSIAYVAGVTMVLPMEAVSTNIARGLRLLWHPAIIIACQLFWTGIFLYMGRSQVTSARICFQVHRDRI